MRLLNRLTIVLSCFECRSIVLIPQSVHIDEFAVMKFSMTFLNRTLHSKCELCTILVPMKVRYSCY
ncbi:hypothetical protein THOD04_30302 [Vibrio owensii]|nr:hypothetical protein THOD04_30302 [Vibrio owensii]